PDPRFQNKGAELMFRTALISLDYSAAQGPLLDCLADLREMGVTRAILTHVVKVGYGQGASYGNKEALEDWLRGRAEPLRKAGLDVDVDVRAAGEVAKDILAAATEHGADLIVIGSRGQNMIRGLFLGSVAREVIRLSPLPLRLEWIEATGKAGDAACERTCHAGLRRVLLATDFSQQSQAAEKAAIEIGRLGAHVDVLHVLSPDGGKIYTRWPSMAQAALTYIAQDVQVAGGLSEVHLVTGKPSTEIARIAAEHDTDLIIVGKHGQGWANSLAVGSTAASLCEIARRP
ncbi:MAG: universal stress protein, partial [Pararhodobacter sp.]